MDFESIPQLISNKTLKQLNKLCLNNNIQPNIINTDYNTYLLKFYKNYIKKNLFPLILVGFILLILLIKFIIKKEKDEDKIQKINYVNEHNHEHNHEHNLKQHKDIKDIETKKIEIKQKSDLEQDQKQKKDLDLDQDLEDQDLEDLDQDLEDQDINFEDYDINTNNEYNDDISTHLLNDNANNLETKTKYDKLAKMISGN